MSPPVAVLRPEPGNASTAARLEAAGRRAIRLPLFAIRAIAWEAPDPARFDALLATSANAFRHGGAGLARLTGLPVVAVGEATAAAARAAGFRVTMTGDANAAALAVRLEDGRRLLHLAGRERTEVGFDAGTETITVYAADALPVPEASVRALAGAVALLHSARAARRLGELADAADLRGTIRIAALSAAVAAAAGEGWAGVTVAAIPRDAALVAAALAD